MRAKPTKQPAANAPPCGFFRRLMIMLYDAIVIVALLMVAAFAALPFTGGSSMVLQDPAYTAWIVLVWFAYLAVCWRRGATLGMRAWRVRLVLEGSGGTPGWGRCAARFVLSLLSLAAAGMGYLCMLIDGRRRCWHDMATATVLQRTQTSSD